MKKNLLPPFQALPTFYVFLSFAFFFKHGFVTSVGVPLLLFFSLIFILIVEYKQ